MLITDILQSNDALLPIVLISQAFQNAWDRFMVWFAQLFRCYRRCPVHWVNIVCKEVEKIVAAVDLTEYNRPSSTTSENDSTTNTQICKLYEKCIACVLTVRMYHNFDMPGLAFFCHIRMFSQNLYLLASQRCRLAIKFCISFKFY